METPSLPQHVFISYSSKDTDFATKVRQSLHENSIPVWLDDNIKPGDANYDSVIRQAIKDAFVFVLIASPNSLASNYVLGEIRVAQRQNLPIIPVWVWGDSWEESVYTELIAAQYLDLRETVFAEGADRLVSRLQEIIADTFPDYVVGSGNVPQSLYLTVKRDTQQIAIRCGAYKTIVDLLDTVSNELVPNHQPPMYGNGWILGAGWEGGFSPTFVHPNRLLVPLKWLSHWGKPDLIAGYTPDWYGNSLDRCGLLPGTTWEFIDLASVNWNTSLTQQTEAPPSRYTYANLDSIVDALVMGIALKKAYNADILISAMTQRRASLFRLQTLNEAKALFVDYLRDDKRQVSAFTKADGFQIELHQPSDVNADDYPYAAVFTIPTYSGTWGFPNLQGQVMVDVD